MHGFMVTPLNLILYTFSALAACSIIFHNSGINITVSNTEGLHAATCVAALGLPNLNYARKLEQTLEPRCLDK